MARLFILCVAMLELVVGKACIPISVGSSQQATKTIDVSGVSLLHQQPAQHNVMCPTRVDRHNWLNPDKYSDWFSVIRKGHQITVTRRDSKAGWSMHLKFCCERFTNLALNKPASGPSDALHLFHYPHVRAVDGNIRSIGFHSPLQVNPWYSVDLRKKYSVPCPAASCVCDVYVMHAVHVTEPADPCNQPSRLLWWSTRRLQVVSGLTPLWLQTCGAARSYRRLCLRRSFWTARAAHSTRKALTSYYATRGLQCCCQTTHCVL